MNAGDKETDHKKPSFFSHFSFTPDARFPVSTHTSGALDATSQPKETEMKSVTEEKHSPRK